MLECIEYVWTPADMPLGITSTAETWLLSAADHVADHVADRRDAGHSYGDGGEDWAAFVKAAYSGFRAAKKDADRRAKLSLDKADKADKLADRDRRVAALAARFDRGESLFGNDVPDYADS